MDIQTINMTDLVDAGLISHSTKLYGYFGGYRIEATLMKDCTFNCGANNYSSPSVAAGQAITSHSGRRSPGRNYWSTNGWLFWHVTANDGATKTLADIRMEFFEAQRLASPQIDSQRMDM